MKHWIAATALALALPTAALAADYTIMAPAAPGGGWDQTARAMQEAMTVGRHRQRAGDQRARRRRHHRARPVRQRGQRAIRAS